MEHINDAMNKTIGYEKRVTTSQTVLKGKVKQSIVCAPVRISLHSTVVSTVYNVKLCLFNHFRYNQRKTIYLLYFLTVRLRMW